MILSGGEMDSVRDLIHDIGLQPEHFNYLIGLVIAVGVIWAVKRIYQDLTGPVLDIYQEDDLVEKEKKLVTEKEKKHAGH